MATRSEQFHANEQRRGETPDDQRRRAARSKPGVPLTERSRAKKHAEKKATYALEETAAGAQPSRKSTRKSANRAKPDTNLTLRESLQKGSPEARYRRASAQRSHSGGSGEHGG
jgi:hypothetical protein